MKWDIAFTTCPRPRSTLTDSVESLIVAGFVADLQDCRYHFFCDAGIEPGEIDDTLLLVPPAMGRLSQEKLGAWKNWRRMLRHMAQLDADLFMLCQDDIRVRPGLRKYLESDIRRDGIYSCYTSGKDAREARNRHIYGGWYLNGTGWAHCGALCYVATKDAITYLDARLPQEVPHNKHIDAHVGKLLKSSNVMPMFMHIPSLVQHTGEGISTMGYAPAAWLRTGHGYTDAALDIQEHKVSQS